MPKFVIEREVPGASQMSPAQLKEASQASNGVIVNLAPDIQWVQSFVTDDKIYCVYIASDEQKIKEHAQQAGLPANKISKVSVTIDPSTGE